MSREWGEIHKPLPAILQKFDQGEKEFRTSEKVAGTVI